MREKKNCDCGIRERKRNKGGRRREGGMTFRGRRREEWRQKGGTLCDSSKGWEKKKKEREGDVGPCHYQILRNTSRQSKQIIRSDRKWPFNADMNEVLL